MGLRSGAPSDRPSWLWGALTVQLPDTHPVLVGEPVVQRVAHWAAVVGLHDRARGCHMAQPDGMAELMDGHCKQVHAVGIWGHGEPVSLGAVVPQGLLGPHRGPMGSTGALSPPWLTRHPW